MTANEPGHINNLDRNQNEALKVFWKSLITGISEDSSQLVDCALGEELFCLFGIEHPDSVLLRWLRARKWNIEHAVDFMINTLMWRRDWSVRELIRNGESDLSVDECLSGKIYTMGKDKANRPVTYVHANRHIKGEYPLEVTEKLLILLMETGRYLLESPNEDGTVVIDMADVHFRNLDYQHIKFMIHSMQSYYPECLGLGIVVNAPWSFTFVWNMIKPWLDPVVVSKIHFLSSSEDLSQFIDAQDRPECMAGNRDNFCFSPSSDDDRALIAQIRNDRHGMNKALDKHKQTARDFVQSTLKWIESSNLEERNNESQRSEDAQRLKDSFQQLLPYISTRTHYHRIGQIDDNSFQDLFSRLRQQPLQTTDL